VKHGLRVAYLCYTPFLSIKIYTEGHLRHMYFLPHEGEELINHRIFLVELDNLSAFLSKVNFHSEEFANKNLSRSFNES